jgi:predicted nuclease of predicted toxin-antitoxin system
MLLLDNNLSPKLCRQLDIVYPGIQHVENVGLEDAPDNEVWDYAKSHNLAIVTKDSDFNQRVQLYGHPPKVIWLRCGNATTAYILNLISSSEKEIRNFLKNHSSGILEIY